MLERLIREFLYYPTRIPEGAPLPGYAQGAREIWYTNTLGDRLHALYWPAPSGRPTFLFFHGNAQSVFEWALVRAGMAPVEAGLFLADYPGYGKCSGTPSERSLFATGEAAHDHLTRALGVPAERIVVFGKSLGGPVAAHVAAHRETAGIVLESTFVSLEAVARRLFPFLPSGALLGKERFETGRLLSRVHAPLLIIHGTQDELIPVEQGRELFALANEPKACWYVEGAGHNDVAMTAGSAYGEKLRQWIDQAVGGHDAPSGRKIDEP